MSGSPAERGAGGIGGLLAREWGSNDAYYHADAQGNVTALINGSGAVMASYQYDPFGNILSSSGSWAGVNRYRFSSKERFDAGLYYYGYRFYHPDLQRWMNRDPIGELGGINLYEFVYSNPVVFVDPYGLYSFGELCSIAGHGFLGGFQGAAVNVDEFLPFVDPFSGWAYNPNNPAIQNSKKLAAFGQTVYTLGGKKLLQEGSERGLGALSDAARVAKQRARRAARREARSRKENGQNLSGQGFRDHANAHKGPRGERPKGPGPKDRERNRGIDEEHSRVAKGTGGGQQCN